MAVKSEDYAPDSYCVGGAICLAVGVEIPDDGFCPRGFPNADIVATALLFLAPSKLQAAASEAAAWIIKLNDVGDFDRAWAVAENFAAPKSGDWL